MTLFERQWSNCLRRILFIKFQKLFWIYIKKPRVGLLTQIQVLVLTWYMIFFLNLETIRQFFIWEFRGDLPSLNFPNEKIYFLFKHVIIYPFFLHWNSCLLLWLYLPGGTLNLKFGIFLQESWYLIELMNLI